MDFFSHYPGHAVTFPNISLILANLAQAVISTLASGKRSDKMRISPFPLVVLASSYFQVVLMSNVDRFSISRIIGIDYTYPTGKEGVSDLSPLFRFVHSVNIFSFMQHFLGQHRTPDGILVTPIARPFFRSTVRDLTQQDVTDVDWGDHHSFEDLLDTADYYDNETMTPVEFCGTRIRWFGWSVLDSLPFPPPSPGILCESAYNDSTHCFFP